jgi:hypothetical protein
MTGAVPDNFFKETVHGFTLRHRESGKLVTKILERELYFVGNSNGISNSVRQI